jgi:phage shock protein C
MTRNSRTLQLDHANKKFLGVCAGIANYLDVKPWSVRLVFIGCCIFGGWFLIPLYFAVWFLLDDASSPLRSSLADNLAVKHFRTVDYKKPLYRNTREAKWLGICAGIADYLEVSAFAVRLVFLLLVFTTGGLPLLFYFAAWLVLDVRPERSAPAAGVADEEFHSRRREIKYCARKLASLQERLARMEAYVTSSRFRLHREFRNIS